MKTCLPRRGGFTLIELLVVMALLAILAAIAAGAFFRVRAASESTATQSTLEKLNSGIDRKWKAVIDQATVEAKNTPVGFQTACGNDPDRVRIVLTYMKLKNEFPTTIAEANTAINFGGPTGLTLQPRTGAFGPISAFTGSNEEQSAACLFQALTATGTGGEVFDVTPLQSQIKTINGAQMFVDSWGKPIMFVRQAYPAEVNAAPYTPPGSPRDPVDPIGKLASWGSMGTFWPVIQANHVLAIPNYSATQNWVPTAVSMGPNEQWGDHFGGNDAGNDNLISFRLRKAGAKGN